MDLAVIGTGYVGLVTGACLADFGHNVVCVDSDARRIESLCRGDMPFYEPGLTEVVQRTTLSGRLRFTTNHATAVRSSTVIFLAVGTPEGANGEVDLSQIASAVQAILPHLHDYCVVATKSTVPAGTGAWLSGFIQRQLPSSAQVDIVSNPEFLREGSAINDFMRPDRVVIGTTSERAAAVMREVYRPLYLIETPIVLTDIETAELVKYASNAFLAVKISFINEVAALCDRLGADVHVVAKGMGLDKRIGSKFLHPGPGYGGSCFPKDTRALAAVGVRAHARQRLIETAIEVNDHQKEILVQKIDRALGGVAGRVVAVLGLAFKPNTSDVREAPAIHLCRALVEAGAKVQAFDPVANAEAARALGETSSQVTLAGDPYTAASGADAVVIMTEWNEFRTLDLERIRAVMRRAVIVDARNVLDPARALALGFAYVCTGRQRLAATSCVSEGAAVESGVGLLIE